VVAPVAHEGHRGIKLHSMAHDFQGLDQQKAELERTHPGWWIWYVPAMTGVDWCARPHPGLTEHSPEDLQKAISEAEADWGEARKELAR
jgi:hypothetical protein